MRSRYGQLPEATGVDDTESTPAKGHSAAADIVESALPGQELSGFEDMHLLRKMLHMLWGCIFIVTRHQMDRRIYKFDRMLALLLSFVILVETSRLQYPRVNRLLRSWLHPFMRKGEQTRFSGVLYYLAGVFVVSKIAEANFLVFDAAVANLAIGDPMSSMAGIVAGEVGRLPNGKSVVGFAIGWMSSFGALIAVYAVTREARREMAILGFHSERHRLAMALFGGCVGAAAELAVPTPPPQLSSPTFPLGLDDNLVVPVVSCVIIQNTVDMIAGGHVF